MKKTTIIISLAAITSLSLLQSCNGKSQANTQMQKPATESTSNEKDDAEGKSDKLTSPEANATNIQNMQAAFKGETTASAKYAAYSKKAEAEGHHQIALLFLAASKSEKIHATNHKAVIEDAGQKTPAITPEFTVKTTAENLKDAIAGESYEVSTMYPEFLKNANTA